MADINESLLDALDGKGPQTKKVGQNAFQWWEGRNGAGYVEILGADGNPISSTNKMPVDVDGQSVNVGNLPTNQDVTITNQTLSTQLTGRNVEEQYFCNGLAITDTAIHTTDKIDLGKYKKIAFSAINTHDQPANIYLQQGNSTLFYYDKATGAFKISAHIAIPSSAGPNDHILNDANPELFDRPLYGDLRFIITFDIAPTSGSLSILAWGVPN